mgnify:CR=1 FL=1
MEEPKNIFKISKDVARANDLFEMTQERLNIIIKSIPESVPYKILEVYYEISVQLITSLMYLEGYKTLSHVALIHFLFKGYGFNHDEIRILDNMRKFRHGTVYYGRKESGNFYINHKEEINRIVNKLINLVEKKLKESK